MSSSLKNLALRLLNALIWVPIAFCSVFIYTQKRHFLARILVIFFSVISGYEFANIIKRTQKISGYEGANFIKRTQKFGILDFIIFIILSSFIPILTFFHQEFLFSISFLVFIGICFLLLIFFYEVFFYNESQSGSVISRLGNYCFCLVYPGFFFTYLMLVTTLKYPTTTLLLFLCLTFLNDSFAYFFGIFLGKISKTRGFIRVSPGKSLIGFLGGILASVCVTILYFYWGRPNLFGQRSVYYAIIMGIICGLASIVGDLFESLLKRSVDIKDSGNFFIGRGGVLDTFDSLMFAAPVFYYFMIFI